MWQAQNRPNSAKLLRSETAPEAWDLGNSRGLELTTDRRS